MQSCNCAKGSFILQQNKNTQEWVCVGVTLAVTQLPSHPRQPMDLSVGGTIPPHPMNLFVGKKTIHLHSNTHYCFCPVIQVVFFIYSAKVRNRPRFGEQFIPQHFRSKASSTPRLCVHCAAFASFVLQKCRFGKNS